MCAESIGNLVYIVRHGQTFDNAQGRLSGLLPTKLNEQGQREARALHAYIRHVKFTHAYSSDLVRARETVEILLASQPLEAIPTADLREIGVGIFEGRSIHEMVLHQKSTGLADSQYIPPQGEELHSVIHRVDSFIAMMAALPQKATVVLIVAHSGINKILIGRMLGKSIEDSLAIPQSNACISLIQKANGRWLDEYINFTGHLDVLKS